jgi:uncharacterized protein YndB with AHSA1/START domain
MSYDIVVERLLDTTPEVAYHQWISAEGRKQWYAGSTDWVVEAETDLRAGGTFWVTWGPAGKPEETWREEGTLDVVDIPARLEYRSLTTPPPAEGEPLETQVQITFGARDGKTLMRLRETGYPTEEMRDMIEPFVVEGVGYFAASLPGAA